MTDRKLDETISKWLEAEAPRQVSDRVLRATFERTRKSRQHGDWRAILRKFDVPEFVAVFGSAAAVLVVAVVAFGLYVNRPGIGDRPSPSPSATPTVTASPSAQVSSPPDFMWPQSTLDEVRAAQTLADGGDPRYQWQVSPDRWQQPSQHHPIDSEFFAQFFEEVLGWEEFLWDEAFAHPDGLEDGDVVFIRCAPGGTNPLYLDDLEAGCGPTIDELRYQTVKVNIAQLVGQGPSGIWVVTGWAMIEPSEQIAPPSDAEITAVLGAFLQARIDGEGAEGFADLEDSDQLADERVNPEIPLLYATSAEAAYERSEFELVDGPVWPSGWMQFEIRLFAENGETVVEQVFALDQDATGRLRLVYDLPSVTTENGTAMPAEWGFLDGAVTYRASYPLEPSQDGYRASDRLAIVGVLPDDDFARRVLLILADPRPVGPGCVLGAAPEDTEALAQIIASNPDFDATPPVAVTIGGIPALRMDVVLTPAASSCPWSEGEVSSTGPLLLQHAPFMEANRARLYLIDLPGGSARILALATITDEDSFETVLGWAAPVIDSIEFHAP